MTEVLQSSTPRVHFERTERSQRARFIEVSVLTERQLQLGDWSIAGINAVRTF